MAEGSNINNFNLILRAQISKAQKGECKIAKMTFICIFVFYFVHEIRYQKGHGSRKEKEKFGKEKKKKADLTNKTL